MQKAIVYLRDEKMLCLRGVLKQSSNSRHLTVVHKYSNMRKSLQCLNSTADKGLRCINSMLENRFYFTNSTPSSRYLLRLVFPALVSPTWPHCHSQRKRDTLNSHVNIITLFLSVFCQEEPEATSATDTSIGHSQARPWADPAPLL